MIFLIQFDRSAHRIVVFECFDDTRHTESVKRRLELEISAANANLDHEVVLLEAENEKQIRRTHRRYFEDVVRLGAELKKVATKEKKRHRSTHTPLPAPQIVKP